MKKQSENSIGGMLLNLLIGALSAIAVACVLLFPCAVLVSGGSVGESSMSLLTLAAAFLGGMSGALIAWRRQKSRALLLGAGGAALAFLILFLFGRLFSDEAPLAAQAIGIFLALLLGGLLGGALRLRKKKRRK